MRKISMLINAKDKTAYIHPEIKEESLDVLTFIGRMVQHILPKGFQRIRYYGLQATKTYEK